VNLNVAGLLVVIVILFVSITFGFLFYRICRKEQKERVLYFLRLNYDNFDLLELKSSFFSSLIARYGIVFHAKIKNKNSHNVKTISVLGRIFGDVEYYEKY
jgi:hypothetical protein